MWDGKFKRRFRKIAIVEETGVRRSRRPVIAPDRDNLGVREIRQPMWLGVMVSIKTETPDLREAKRGTFGVYYVY